jgi:glutathione peroxidase
VTSSIYDIDVTRIDGRLARMSEWRGRTMLIVNVASACGYTPQYRGLEKLYREYRHRGFVVLAFPCNQFGTQEPGTEDQIRRFCEGTYEVTFPMFKKIDVNGEHTHPLFALLKSARKGLLGSESIKWNFTKFLVGPDGEVLRRYGSGDTPEKIDKDVVSALPVPASDAVHPSPAAG